jgi:tetratricopeptide (TPR) repeat protein
MKMHPFFPLSPEHKIDSVDFSISYNFTSDSIESSPKFIQFNYSFCYNDNYSAKHITTNGILYFFENNKLFYNPRFSQNDYSSSAINTQNGTSTIDGSESRFIYSKELGTYTDYDKIVSMPYNEFFWNHNDVILQSDNKKSYLEFFKENGVLLNYNELSALSDVHFYEKKLKWSPNSRITSEILNKKNNFSINSNNNLNYSATMCLDDFYNLKGQIFMDINQFGDSISVLTSTLIDLDESFFYLQKEAYTDCFINNYFDLIEMQRRNMLNDLNKHNYSVTQIDSVYNLNILQLNEIQTQYLKECARGSNAEELDKWSKIINKSLGINNAILFNDSISGLRLRTELSGESGSSVIEKYNTASALYNIGKYEEAKIIFLEAIEDGDNHPWLFYNLALTCYKLDETENACKYIKLSEEAGEKPDSALIRTFCR